MITINTDVSLNDRHQNAAIQGHILDDVTMRANGFVYVEPLSEWYMSNKLYEDITLNISISTIDSSIRIDVLDERFCQPYDYQHILLNSKQGTVPKVAELCYNRVTDKFKALQHVGIISGFVEGDYI